jgi:hypothetical protein
MTQFGRKREVPMNRFGKRTLCIKCGKYPLIPELKGKCWICYGKELKKESDIVKILTAKAQDIYEATTMLKKILEDKGEFTTQDIRRIAPDKNSVVGWSPHIKRKLNLDSEVLEPGFSRYFPKTKAEKPVTTTSSMNNSEYDKYIPHILKMKGDWNIRELRKSLGVKLDNRIYWVLEKLANSGKIERLPKNGAGYLRFRVATDEQKQLPSDIDTGSQDAQQAIKIAALLRKNTKLEEEIEKIKAENKEWKHIAETSIHYMLNPDESSTVERLMKIFKGE